MRRVVVTGMGIVSCIGNTLEDVSDSLWHSRSGICAAPEYARFKTRSRVHGKPEIETAAHIDRRTLRFMDDGAAWNYIAMQRAIDDAALEQAHVSHPRTGLIMGSGTGSCETVVKAADIAREKGVRAVGPYCVPKAMASTHSATLAVPFKILGVNYSISAACTTSTLCVGNAAELIQFNKQDIVFAGGGESLHWTLSILFDAMGALSSKYNDIPPSASRPFDKNRDGFVIAGGAGVLVLESLEHALARGAKIYCELTGYGATSDGYDMVRPSSEAAARCMHLALETVSTPVDYINPHATSTPVGDASEITAIRSVFGKNIPPIAATKSLTGHSLGACGVQEAIYSILCLQKDFIPASAHIETIDEDFADVPIARTRQENAGLNCVLTNSFGFGGTNGTLVFSRYAR